MKTKVFVVAVLFLAFGQSVVTPLHAQAPPPKPPKKAHRAAAPIVDSSVVAAQAMVAQDTEPAVVPLSSKDLPQDPLRVTIQNSAIKAMEAAKVPAAGQHVAPVAASGGVTDSATGGRQRKRAGANAAAATGGVAVAVGDQAGIAALQSAQSSVSSIAGQKWGGHHKTKAEGLISQALAACGQPKAPPPQAQAAPADPSAAMTSALQQLATAKSALAAATNACGAGRDQAIALITQAQTEVQASIDFAKSHQ
jgi:hypothetical protein